VPDRASGDTFIGFAQQTKEIYALANISGRASAECLASYEHEPWKCALGVYRMPFQRTPYMMVASQSDQFQIGSDIGHQPTTPQELAYAQELADFTHGNASKLIGPGTTAAADGSTVFSMNCWSHSTSLTDPGMSGMNIAGWRMMDALASFVGLSSRPLPVGGLFDPSKGFASVRANTPYQFCRLYTARDRKISTEPLGLPGELTALALLSPRARAARCRRRGATVVRSA
jgi:hypothetical protein